MNFERVTVFNSVLTYKLPTIVSYDGSKDAISCNYVAPNKLTYLLISDGTQWFSFHVLGEMIYGHNYELPLALCRGKGS